MGYLSCNAESAILTSNTITNNNNNKSKKPTTTHNKEESSSSSSPPEEKPIKFQQFQYSDLEAATNGFSDKKLLGKGSHGCVYKAVLRSGRLVAVKRPSRSSSSSSLRPSTTPSSSDYIANEVDNEIDILSKIQSPRLVNLVGFTTDSRDRLLVVEFMSNGTLYDVIHSSPRPPNWGRRIRLALQTAKAIDTLHSSSPPVIHRDIKSANVLIDRNFNARLGDFGLALRCHVDDFRLLSTPPAGTIGYLDPGYVTPDNLSTKTDVFSFGILLLEIISGRKAIDIGHSPPSIVEWAVPLARKGKFLSVYDPRILPPKDPSVRKQLLVLASKCVRSCRERRPSMKDVVESLSVMSKMVPLHSWNGFSVTNPCMMVEAVGRPVESRNGELNSRPRRRGEGDNTLDNNVVGQMRNSRRVYSDLGVGTRSNLMDLMAERDLTESDSRGEGGDVEPVFSRTRGSSLRIGNERRFSRERTQSSAHEYDKDGLFQLRRNRSVGGMFRKSLREEVLDRSNGGLKHQNISS